MELTEPQEQMVLTEFLERMELMEHKALPALLE
jgi:hypothetical protein